MSKQDKTATGENAALEQTDRELLDREMEEVAGGVSGSSWEYNPVSGRMELRRGHTYNYHS